MFKNILIVMLKGFFPYLFKFQSHVNEDLAKNKNDIKSHYLRIFPPKLATYLLLIRFDRPTGTLLVLIPALWSLAFYGTNQPFLLVVYYHILVILGAFIARSIGCIINDIIDINIDKEVLRTKQRPLPSKQITIFKAVLFAVLLSLIGLFILTRFNNNTVYIIGSSFILIACYPLMKKLVKIPQIFLGIVFNWGVFIGPLAYNNFNFKIFLLYIAGVLITFAYDSSYSIQDIRDDKNLHTNSSAIYFGNNIKKAILVAYVLALVFFMLFLSLNHMLNAVSLTLLTLALIHILWQVKNIDLINHHNNLVVFNSNTFLLFLLYFTSFV